MAEDRSSEGSLPPNRRDFLTGKALLTQVSVAGGALADQLLEGEERAVRFPAGPTVRLGKSAMACEFDVILNPGPGGRLSIASEMLELIDRLEDQVTV